MPVPIIIQPPPAAPAEGAPWQDWDIYLRRVAIYNDALMRPDATSASAANAIAHEACATAMREGAAATRALAHAASEPVVMPAGERALSVASAIVGQGGAPAHAFRQAVDLINKAALWYPSTATLGD